MGGKWERKIWREIGENRKKGERRLKKGNRRERKKIMEGSERNKESWKGRGMESERKRKGGRGENRGRKRGRIKSKTKKWRKGVEKGGIDYSELPAAPSGRRKEERKRRGKRENGD